MNGIFADSSLESLFKAETIAQETNTGMSFIVFIDLIEGWKTRCKNLHWSAPKKNVHEDLDKFMDALNSFEDSIVEDYQGTNGKFQPNAVKGTQCDCLNAIDLIKEVIIKTKEFYNTITDDIDYIGIKSETESFIHKLKVFAYLFSLDDVRPY